MKLLFLLVAALSCVGVSVGTDCSPFARPWLVSLSNGQTGVLLNEWWVLTKVTFPPYGSQQVARLGVDDLTGQSDTEQKVSVAEWIYNHHYRHRRKRSLMNSLVLVRLAWPARFTPQVQPIALPTRCPQTGERCVLSGWGSSDSGTGSRKQQCLVREVLSDSACRQALGDRMDDVFCTGPQHTTECNCLRDSNSVLVCGGVLQGVRSFVEGCSSGKPDSFSSICQYRSWIDTTMSTMTPTVGPPTTASTSTVLLSAWPYDDIS